MWRRRSRRRWLLPWCSCLSGKKAGSWWIHAAVQEPSRSRLLSSDSNIAPGLNRSFACEDWEFIDKNLWKEEKRAAFQAIRYDEKLDITGMDIDSKAVAAAKQNAEEAGVEDCIHFRRADAAKLHAQGQNGILITNPPYGERIGEEKEIQKIYGGLKNFLQNHPDWSLFLVTTDKDAEEKILQRKADRRRKLYNGRLEVCYYQFHGQKPGK